MPNSHYEIIAAAYHSSEAPVRSRSPRNVALLLEHKVRALARDKQPHIQKNQEQHPHIQLPESPDEVRQGGGGAAGVQTTPERLVDCSSGTFVIRTCPTLLR